MTKGIVACIIVGGLFGFFIAPDALIEHTGIIISVSLVVFAFTIGLELGGNENLFSDIKEQGFGVLLVLVAIVGGTLTFGALTALVLPYSVGELLAVSAGLGWYSLVPALLLDYSSELSAVSFLHNVLRETVGIILIPIIAKRVGWLETIALPGAGCMDICLPLIERATGPKIVVYSFITGFIMSLLIPLMVTAIMNIFLV